MKKDLHKIAIRIYKLCLDHKRELEIEWIPRTEMQKADYISKLVDRKHGALTQSIVLLIITTQKPEGFLNDTGTQFVRGEFCFCPKCNRRELSCSSTYLPYSQSFTLFTKT
jgi:hypothetical protein